MSENSRKLTERKWRIVSKKIRQITWPFSPQLAPISALCLSPLLPNILIYLRVMRLRQARQGKREALERCIVVQVICTLWWRAQNGDWSDRRFAPRSPRVPMARWMDHISSLNDAFARRSPLNAYNKSLDGLVHSGLLWVFPFLHSEEKHS